MTSYIIDIKMNLVAHQDNIHRVVAFKVFLLLNNVALNGLINDNNERQELEISNSSRV